MNLDKELDKQKQEVLEMMALVLSQLEKVRDCILESDLDLAYEINHSEIRIDAYELNIEKNCGALIALMNPVASDMRFILSMLRMINDLERIGDNANGIADFFTMDHMTLDQSIVESCALDVMLNVALTMMNTVYMAFMNDDSAMARKIFKMDKEMNKLFHQIPQKLEDLHKQGSLSFQDGIHLYSIARKLERTGDLIKNIGESIVFHLDAKNLKHKDARKLK